MATLYNNDKNNDTISSSLICFVCILSWEYIKTHWCEPFYSHHWADVFRKKSQNYIEVWKSKDVEIYLIAEITVRAMEVMENQDVINLFFVHNLSNIKRNKNSLQILSNQVLNLSKCIGIMQRKGFGHQFASKLSHAKCIFLEKPYHNISRRHR